MPVQHSQYEFTNTWFRDTAQNFWDKLVPQLKPTKILEIGSYEGASACYLIDKVASTVELELHCVDTWAGGVEHGSGGEYAVDMRAVEERFHRNIGLAQARAGKPVALRIHKSRSDVALSTLIAQGFGNHFDLIYIDGSHQAPDVLSDAILAFRLVRKGGVVAFDDYLWFEGLPTDRDPLRTPKPAVDAFVNIYIRRLNIIYGPSYQFYVQKICD